MIKNLVLHFNLVNKHRFKVFKLCCKAGIPFRGLMHDLSKYSPVEFFESVKYYQGTYSPIHNCKKENGYSKAWLHHKGRNKHHPEYWLDTSLEEKTIIMPYKYAAEMVCDKLAAGIVYSGKNWTKELQLNYHLEERKTSMMHPQIEQFLRAIFTEISKDGLEKTLTEQNVKKLYEKYCIRMENLDENQI